MVENDPAETTQVVHLRTGCEEAVRDTALIEQLDGARLHPGGPGSLHVTTGTLLEQDHLDTPAAQFGGQGQAGGSGPRDDHRSHGLVTAHLELLDISRFSIADRFFSISDR